MTYVILSEMTASATSFRSDNGMSKTRTLSPIQVTAQVTTKGCVKRHTAESTISSHVVGIAPCSLEGLSSSFCAIVQFFSTNLNRRQYSQLFKICYPRQKFCGQPGILFDGHVTNYPTFKIIVAYLILSKGVTLFFLFDGHLINSLF